MLRSILWSVYFDRQGLYAAVRAQGLPIIRVESEGFFFIVTRKKSIYLYVCIGLHGYVFYSETRRRAWDGPAEDGEIENSSTLHLRGTWIFAARRAGWEGDPAMPDHLDPLNTNLQMDDTVIVTYTWSFCLTDPVVEGNYIDRHDNQRSYNEVTIPDE